MNSLQQQHQQVSTLMQNYSKIKENESGISFILNHFDPNGRISLFPRTIMTKKLGYQKEVFSKEEAMEFFKESDLIDCRINAFPSYTEYKGVQRYPPNLLFIDLDKNDFETITALKLALFNTLKNIKEKLNGFPTVLWSGNGYHIIQPVSCPKILVDGILETAMLEDITEFKKHDKPSQKFLRFAKDYFSNSKADKNNNPSFKSCLLRIPGSINSKYDKNVTIIQKWNGVRPAIRREFIEKFRTYLIQKKIDEKEQKQKMLLKLKRQQNNYKSITHNGNYYQWIDKNILSKPFKDYRKIIVNLILAPYLIVIKKLSFEDAFEIINEWLQKCDLLRRLDFNKKFLVTTALTTAYKKQIPPMKMITLKTNYKDLYLILVQKEKEERVG